MPIKVTEKQLNRAFTLLERAIKKAVKKYGDRVFYSKHEALGVLTEETAEYLEAVHDNNLDAQREELLDVAVTALWEVASIDARGGE